MSLRTPRWKYVGGVWWGGELGEGGRQVAVRVFQQTTGNIRTYKLMYIIYECTVYNVHPWAEAVRRAVNQFATFNPL